MLKIKRSSDKAQQTEAPNKPSWLKDKGIANIVQKIRQPKKLNWLKISVLVNISILVVAVIALGGMEVIHQSDTNPNLCGLCHVMQTNVTSYQTSMNLDHVHMQAGIQCKDCHSYPISAEITSGINFMIGNYAVDSKGELIKRKYDDAMCLKCHISEEHIRQTTDYLFRNPHNSHWGQLPCSDCHISHGAQFDYCSQCHENGGQRMIEEPIKERGTIKS